MPDNINNDYNELAKLIYPSIEASGNVYYGQTRKLAIDELFNINDGGFESNIKTVRKQTDNNEDGFEYISYFCWKFGPLNGRIRIVPCDNDKFIFTFANFPELEKIYHLDDTYIANDSTDPIVGTLFIRYKLLLNDNTVEHILNSGTFNSYEKFISLDTNDIRVYITDNCDPTNIDNRDIDDRNIFVKHENDAYYLFVKLCKCADVENPGDALCFTNMNENGASTISLNKIGELQAEYEYYKSSLERWEKYNIGDVITLHHKNDKVYFRGSRSQQGFDNYIQFNLTGKLSAGGNINSLLSHDESIYKNITDYTTFENANGQTFYSLFFNQTSLYDASALKLNTHNLATYCYACMFRVCTNLTQAPELSATILNDYCYESMFEDCTSLIQAPELPATTLSNDCYGYMFKNCTSLIQAPELPATTLANDCYGFMFQNCTSLNQAPELPATQLTEYCYMSMFEDCTSLIQAPELPATTLANDCYNNMFSGCTSLVQAHELPATQLTEYCYMSMFENCTSLTQAPELPATTLANDCYNNMFSGCTSLVQAPELPATQLTEYCYRDMFRGCTSLVQAPELPATLLEHSCYMSMFENCTSLIQAPELPATQLAEYCYNNMFSDCTSLVQAPELPATTLARACYNYMFWYCTSLNYIKCLATDISAEFCTDGWLSDVSATGDFYTPSATIWTSGANGIPTGWTRHDVDV